MRAHWVPELEIQEMYLLQNEAFHHLVHVVRIEKNEELLLLDGRGLVVRTIVQAISKRELRLGYLKHSMMTLPYHFDLALGIPKRDALDLCLKEATELGFRKIFLIKSAYSQIKVPDTERLEKITVAALEQSNSPFLPEIHPVQWESIGWGDYEEIVLLDSQLNSVSERQVGQGSPKLLIVGPEGGFSPDEIDYFSGIKSLRPLKLPTPLLRTPTAVATGAGIMIEHLLK
jgi:16S rRNA (uracil1498-N3)-methyltransferase